MQSRADSTHSSTTRSSPPAGPSVTFDRRSPTTIGGKYRVTSKAGRGAPCPGNFESESVPCLPPRPALRGKQGRRTVWPGASEEGAAPGNTWMAMSRRAASAYDRVSERRRAVALARHFSDAEGLSIAQIADRLGRSPATVKAYFYDPSYANKRPTDSRRRDSSGRSWSCTDVDLQGDSSALAATARGRRSHCPICPGAVMCCRT